MVTAAMRSGTKSFPIFNISSLLSFVIMLSPFRNERLKSERTNQDRGPSWPLKPWVRRLNAFSFSSVLLAKALKARLWAWVESSLRDIKVFYEFVGGGVNTLLYGLVAKQFQTVGLRCLTAHEEGLNIL